MKYGILLGILALGLLGMAVLKGGWFWFLLWPITNLMFLSVAYSRNSSGVFGKRPDGTLPVWSWIVFFPWLIFTLVVWHVTRIVSKEPARNIVTPKLVIGRRLLESEQHGTFDNYIDLTAEFREPPSVRRTSAYTSFPILDGAVPNAESLIKILASLKAGQTFVHCAQGHGRTGLFALVLLLADRTVLDVEQGLRLLQHARPMLKLNSRQREFVESFAQSHLKLVAVPSGVTK